MSTRENTLCTFTFTKKTKPEFCPDCRAELGGTYVPKAATKAKARSTGTVVSVAAEENSVRYHKHHRCVLFLNGLLFIKSL